MKKRMKVTAVAAVVLCLTGCRSGVLAPRSGELFQTTRMGPGDATVVCSYVTIAGMLAASEGHPAGLLFAVAGLPLAVPAFVVDECVVSPLTDLCCLPYDLCQPNHGFYIRVVDESGKPVPDMKIEGGVKSKRKYMPFGSSFDGMTDSAGEFYVSGLFNLRGSFRALAPGYMPWFYSRKIKLDGVKPETDGRIVLQYVVKKSDLGAWKAKTDISREKLLSILPGKWSADPETRKLLAAELHWPSTNAADKHCFTIDPAGSVVSGVPEYYHYYSAFYEQNPWRDGDKFARWQLHQKGELELRGKIAHREQEGWLWAIRLSKDSHAYGIQDEYYLGEDEKGIYLSPGFHREFVCPEITLKFRKVAGSPAKRSDGK